jgi:hypothetical protein
MPRTTHFEAGEQIFAMHCGKARLHRKHAQASPATMFAATAEAPAMEANVLS